MLVKKLNLGCGDKILPGYLNVDVVASLRAGRFTVANPLPAYRPLAAYCWLGDSIVEGLRWALEHPDEAQRRVLAGQAFVAATYSPEAVAGAWEAALAQGARGC